MKYTVLVVDDESLIAKNIKRSIEKGNPNFEVIGMCSTGTEALLLEQLKFYSEGQFCCLYSDGLIPVTALKLLLKWN